MGRHPTTCVALASMGACVNTRMCSVRVCAVRVLTAHVRRLKTYTDTSFRDLDLMNVTGLGFKFPSSIQRPKVVNPGKRLYLPKKMFQSDTTDFKPRVVPLVSTTSHSSPRLCLTN